MNQALCNKCAALVPASTLERGDSIFLVKHCAQCGDTETLISSDKRRYLEKRSLDMGFDHPVCHLNCLNCNHRQPPTLVFIDVTNRCNMNCPICINNTPSMGFLFEPPIEYFRKILRHFAAQNPPPSIQLFGGEPTVRDDLLRIIRYGRKELGLAIRVVTNGLRLADKQYCQDLLRRKPTILISYDGDNAEMYRALRGSDKALDLKRQAIRNIRDIGGAKTTLMTLVAKDYNAAETHRLFEFAHDARDTVRAVYLMPLAHSWKKEDWDYEPVRTTTEDLENVVARAYPAERIDFLPAGLLGQLDAIKRCLRVRPLPFLGAHPNCESMYLLVSDGTQYYPIARYLKHSTADLARDILKAEEKMKPRLDRFEKSLLGRWAGQGRLKQNLLYLMAIRSLFPVAVRNLRVARLLKGKGPAKIAHAALALVKLLAGVSSTKIGRAHTTAQDILQIVILPFEDRYCIETDRLERCPAAFAFVDPEDDKVKSVPVCAWGLHKKEIMRKIALKYPAESKIPL